MRKLLRASLLATTLLTAPAFAADTIDVDVGSGQIVKLATHRPLRVAFFSEGTNNSAMTASIEGAKAAVQELGWTIDVLDGRFDAVNQANQIENALNRNYDAFIVKPLEGNVMCAPSSVEAPRRNILTVVAIPPICGRSEGGRSAVVAGHARQCWWHADAGRLRRGLEPDHPACARSTAQWYADWE